MVWSGDRLEDFLQTAPSTSPKVVVADLEKLGADPVTSTERILATTGAELLVVAYTFARRERLAEFNGDRIRVMRAPVSISSLRLQMLSVLVRGILGHDAPHGGKPSSSRPSAQPSPMAEAAPLPAVAPPRFTPAQLGRLQEVTSSIQCECPNHVASILVSLRSFEEYSRTCANRNDADAAIHRMLYERSAEARVVMEAALDRLLQHEQIAV